MLKRCSTLLLEIPLIPNIYNHVSRLKKKKSEFGLWKFRERFLRPVEACSSARVSLLLKQQTSIWHFRLKTKLLEEL